MTTSTAALTAAFNAGVAARNDGKGLSSRLTIAKGKTRDFWEAGWHKADKAARDAYNAPEAVAARKAANAKDAAFFRDLMQDCLTDIAMADARDRAARAARMAQIERDGEAAANR